MTDDSSGCRLGLRRPDYVKVTTVYCVTDHCVGGFAGGEATVATAGLQHNLYINSRSLLTARHFGQLCFWITYGILSKGFVEVFSVYQDFSDIY